MIAMAMFEEHRNDASVKPPEGSWRRKPRTKIALGFCAVLGLLTSALVIYFLLTASPAPKAAQPRFRCSRASGRRLEHPNNSTAQRNGLCYEFIRSNLTLDEARMQCAVSGYAKLVKILSGEEEDFVNELVKNSCTPWLDFRYDPNDFTLKWADGTPVNYSYMPSYSEQSIIAPDSCFHLDYWTWRPTACTSRNCAVCVSPLVPLR